MRWRAFSACLALLTTSSALLAQNPHDLKFELRFSRDPAVFRAGETIEFALCYSTTSQGKYLGTWSSPRPESDRVVLHLSPLDGVSDRRRPVLDGISFLEGSGPVPEEPVCKKGDLADWFKFRKAGHFSLRATSREVSSLKISGENESDGAIVLSSDAAHLEILNADAGGFHEK